MYWTLFHCVAMGARCSIVCPEGFQCPGAGCLSRGCQHETKRGKRTWVNISVAGSCVGRQASCKGPEEGGLHIQFRSKMAPKYFTVFEQ